MGVEGRLHPTLAVKPLAKGDGAPLTTNLDGERQKQL
jgi:hypothetical protein